MGIIRILLVIAAIWVVWRLVSKVFAPPTSTKQNDASNTTHGGAQTSDSKMLRCEQCGVHVPDTEVFTAKGHHFCSAEHQGRWLEDHNV
ncbi:MAG: PP0621 family protein [Alcanivoracaceae bacterium]|nr:PP0621 family protein [Alcanivoracaceae bacterium]